jgi:hypothetical protein
MVVLDSVCGCVGTPTTTVERLLVEDLAPLDRLTVDTSNSRYEIIVLCPSEGPSSSRAGNSPISSSLPTSRAPPWTKAN